MDRSDAFGQSIYKYVQNKRVNCPQITDAVLKGNQIRTMSGYRYCSFHDELMARRRLS